MHEYEHRAKSSKGNSRWSKKSQRTRQADSIGKYDLKTKKAYCKNSLVVHLNQSIIQIVVINKVEDRDDEEITEMIEQVWKIDKCTSA